MEQKPKGRKVVWNGQCWVCGSQYTTRPGGAIGTCCSLACYSKGRRQRAKLRKLDAVCSAMVDATVQGPTPVLDTIPTPKVILEDGEDCVVFWPGLFAQVSEEWQKGLEEEVAPLFPSQRPTVMYGIRYPPNNPICGTQEPRDVLFFGEPGVADLKYSISRQALPWTPTLLKIRDALAQLIPHLPQKPKFADLVAALVNHYCTGRDHMGKHSNRGVEGGSDPFIMSLSLGCTRPMLFTSQTRKQTKELMLVDGSVVVMLGPRIQSEWKHSVPRDDTLQDSRWNVSMRFHLQQEQVKQVKNVLTNRTKCTPERVLKMLNY